VDENHIDVIDAKLFPETVNVCSDTGGIAGIRLGEDRDFISWDIEDVHLDAAFRNSKCTLLIVLFPIPASARILCSPAA
jgi:hypothetical protein